MMIILWVIILVLNACGLYRQRQLKRDHYEYHTEFYEDDCYWCQKEAVVDGIGRRKRTWRGRVRWLRREIQLRRSGHVELNLNNLERSGERGIAAKEK